MGYHFPLESIFIFCGANSSLHFTSAFILSSANLRLTFYAVEFLFTVKYSSKWFSTYWVRICFLQNASNQGRYTRENVSTPNQQNSFYNLESIYIFLENLLHKHRIEGFLEGNSILLQWQLHNR